MKDDIGWFEIPKTDLARATKFYETIFCLTLSLPDAPNVKMRLFPIEDQSTGVGGAIVDSGGFHRPSATNGSLVYLNANSGVQNMPDKVVTAVAILWF